MPLEAPLPYIAPPIVEETPPSPYPTRPGDDLKFEPPKEEPKIWLYVLITIAALGVLGGGGAVAYNYRENKKLADIPDFKKQKIIDYVKYYGPRGYTKEQLVKHLAQYGVPSSFIEKTYNELGIQAQAPKPSVPASFTSGTAAGASSAGAASGGGFLEKIKSWFKKKEEPPQQGIRQF